MLVEETLHGSWFHGSPYCCMKSIADYEGRVMFVTDSEQVARQYRTPLLGAAKRPRQAAFTEEPTLYTIRLLFEFDKVLDTRKAEHLTLFKEIVEESRRVRPALPLSTDDLIRVPAAPGSAFSGTFPSYGSTVLLLRLLQPHNIVASIIAEGSQGASLAVWMPQSHLEIVSSEPM